MVELTTEVLMLQRQAYLMLVDSIERQLGISPRTAEIRKSVKNPPPQYHFELEYNRAQEKDAPTTES